MKRRELIKLGAAGWVMLSQPLTTLAATQTHPSKKIVWVVLRGAMDSLHAVVPTGDKHLMQHRKALVEPIAKRLLPLNDYFGLHPALANMHQWYQQGEMLPIVAVASPYRERSHFDAQDMLESGLNITDHNSGWLARAFAQYQQNTQSEALAIARSLPISMRGGERVRTWYPSSLPDAEVDLYERLTTLYENDPLLSVRLKEGLETQAILAMNDKKQRNPRFLHLAKSCGELLGKNHEANCAMLEMGGWDTHNGQARRLNNQFTELDNGLAALKTELGTGWKDTVVVIATEFGRTVKVNGTQGTDHGTASAVFVTGGAVNGGKVAGQWPSLAPEQLYQNRDLKPTSDIRQWLSLLLEQHWQLTPQQLNVVFPEVLFNRPETLIRA